MADNTGDILAEDIETEIEADPVAEPESLRSTLEAAFDSASEPSTAAERARDEQGRFTKGQPSEGEPAEIMEPQAPPLAAPSSWTGEKQQMFYQLPRPLQEEVLRRETDLRRHLTTESEQIAQAKRTYSGIDEALAPYSEQLRLANVQPGQVVGHLMAWQQYLDRDPVSALHQLAQSYGLDLRQLANVETQALPVVSPELQEMRRTVEALKREREQERYAQHAALTSSIESEVQGFAMAVDANGHQLRPYVDNVVDEMLLLVPQVRANNPQAGIQQLLQEAYDRAVWANPSTRQLELQRRQQADQSVIRAKAEKAQRAAKLVSGAANGPFTTASPSTLRSAIEAAWEEKTG